MDIRDAGKPKIKEALECFRKAKRVEADRIVQLKTKLKPPLGVMRDVG